MQDHGTARIPLRARDGSVRAYAVVDATDAGWVNQWRWNLNGGYASRGVANGGRGRRTTVYLHRALLGRTPGDGVEVDHIDRDRLNCRRQNLRSVPKFGNRQNRPVKSHSSEHRGVYWVAGMGKWRAEIKANGKRRHLGYFTDEAEAGRTAQRARTTLMQYATN